MRKSTERALKETVDYIDDIVKIAFEKHCIESHCHYNIDMLQIIELAKICYKPQELENFIVRKNTPASICAFFAITEAAYYNLAYAWCEHVDTCYRLIVSCLQFLCFTKFIDCRVYDICLSRVNVAYRAYLVAAPAEPVSLWVFDDVLYRKELKKFLKRKTRFINNDIVFLPSIWEYNRFQSSNKESRHIAENLEGVASRIVTDDIDRDILRFYAEKTFSSQDASEVYSNPAPNNELASDRVLIYSALMVGALLCLDNEKFVEPQNVYKTAVFSAKSLLDCKKINSADYDRVTKELARKYKIASKNLDLDRGPIDIYLPTTSLDEQFICIFKAIFVEKFNLPLHPYPCK